MRLRFVLPIVLGLAAMSATLAARAEEVPATGSNFGGVGLIESRNARFREDGTLEAGTSLRRQRRFHYLSFQALPFLETTFRLADRLNATEGRGSTTDRAFDVKLRLLEEGEWTPAVAVGLQDLIGTGIYSGEYVVASRRFGPFDLSLGLGWGRLGTGGDLDNPLREVSPRFGQRRRDVGRGGTVALGSLFRGEDAALFGGVEYSLPPVVTPLGVVEGLRAKVEWSGDALRDERGGYPARTTGLRGEAETRVNAGLQWSNEWLDAGVHFVHGTDLLVRVSLRADPARPPEPPDRPAPPPVPVRASAVPPDEAMLAARAFDALEAAGFRPLAFALDGNEARVAVSGGPYRAMPQVAARVLRATNAILPASAGMLRVSWWLGGAEVAEVAVPRATLEAAARGTASVEEAYAATTLLPADGVPWPGEARDPGPFLSYGIEPRLALVFGDPTRTLQWQAAVAGTARLDLGAGVSLSGTVQQVVAGNLDRGLPSDSQLTRVRSDYARYAREGETSIPALTAERVWNVAPDVFARATGGLLEPMFGGVSGEVLWRPRDRPYAVGVDLNLVAQRDYRGGFGFLGYSVATGHVSLYADLPLWNLYGIARAGRYLAGDWGGTLELGRRFDSGIEVGGFATITDVPFSRFGEGSFDKGIYVRLPLDLFGARSRAVSNVLIRPVQRDGGQRIAVDTPLWELTRDGRADAVRRGVAGYGR